MTTEKPSENKIDTKAKAEERDAIPPLHREKDIKKHNKEAKKLNEKAEEHGGQEGPEPTRYGDWEKGGRCTDF